MRLQTITGLFPPANFLPLSAEQQQPPPTNKHPQSLVSTSPGLWRSAVPVSWPLTYTPPFIRQLKMYAQLASDPWPLILGSQPMPIDAPGCWSSSTSGGWLPLFWGHRPHPGLLIPRSRGAAEVAKVFTCHTSVKVRYWCKKKNTLEEVRVLIRLLYSSLLLLVSLKPVC